MSIYRYQPINKKTIKCLRNGHIWFTSFPKLNDPYETWCRFVPVLPTIEDKEKFGKYLILTKQCKDQEEKENFISKVNENNFTKYLTDLEKHLNRYLSTYRQEQYEKKTVCCFSKCPNKYLMWAHYGQGLTGICIEYDENIMLVDGKHVGKDIYPVTYTQKVPVVNVDIYEYLTKEINTEGNTGEIDPLFKAIFLTKSYHWKYEDEVRIIFEPKAKKFGKDISHPSSINWGAIKSITYGSKADANAISEIKSVFKGRNIQFKEAVRDKDNYEIRIQQEAS